jgi:large subunit ribosomal protein L28
VGSARDCPLEPIGAVVYPAGSFQIHDQIRMVRVAGSVRDSSPILPAMPKVCHVCAKGPAFGHNRSHSMVATKRRFDPNLQRVRIDDGGTPRRVYVCTRCLKAGKITKAR